MPPSLDDLPLADYLARWLATQDTQLQPQTFHGYRGTIERYLVPHLGATAVGDLDTFTIEATYVTLLRRGGQDGQPLSRKTVVHAHSVLRKALADGVRRGLLRANPAVDAHPPRRDPSALVEDERVQAWTAEELRRFLAWAAGDRFYALWALAAATGMRRGELLGLRWEDVDLEARRLRVRRSLSVVDGVAHLKTTKTGTDRVLGLDPVSCRTLARRRETQDQHRRACGEAWKDRWDLVFTHPDGRWLPPNTVTVAFRRLVRRAPVPTVRLHDLRHTHATLLVEAGVPLKVISARLGHSRIQLTMDTYAHVLPAMDEQAVVAFTAILDQPPGQSTSEDAPPAPRELG